MAYYIFLLLRKLLQRVKEKDPDQALLVSRAYEPTCSELWQALNLGLQDLKEKH